MTPRWLSKVLAQSVEASVSFWSAQSTAPELACRHRQDGAHGAQREIGARSRWDRGRLRSRLPHDVGARHVDRDLRRGVGIRSGTWNPLTQGGRNRNLGTPYPVERLA